MKRIIYTLGIIAAAAFTFSSCQKEQAIDDERPSDKLVTVTFTAEKAGTKTAAVEGTEEVSFIWTDEDISHIKLFTVGAEDALTVVQNPIITKESDTRLTISANVAPGNYIFRAVLAGAWTNDGKKPRVPENQSPIATNFDPSADVLISEDEVVSLVDSGEETVNIGNRLMVFHRPVVVNKMTLKNLAEGEKISKVVISSSKNLAGYFDTKTRAASGDKTSLVLNYTNASVPGSGQYPVYFTTIPNTGHVLTVEVTTDQNIYTKRFAEGASVDFNLGQFTKFNLALPAGVPNTALSLPVEDDMSWAFATSEATTEMGVADLTATQNGKKIYASATKAYKSIDGIKLGTGSATGSITTNEINLSSAFFVAIDAKAYNSSDNAKIRILVDGEEVYTSPSNLTSDYETYFVNCQKATATSKVTIATSTKRGYIKNLVIGSGTYVAPPKITVTSDNPMEVANTASTQTISYTIDNPVEGSALTASTEASWITSINCATSGVVTFNVAAQVAGAPARSGEIILSYNGADPKTVTVNQAAGEGGVSAYDYIFTSATWEATPANWTSKKNGSATGDSRGISIQAAASGAGATSPVSFTGISNITITLSKSSKGVGSVDLYVGENKIATQSSFTTTATEYSFNVDNLDGPVSFVVNCTTSTLYVKGISITAAGVDEGSGGGGSKTATFTFADYGYSNGASVNKIDTDDEGNTDITLTFDSGTNTQNSPMYYTTGSGIRMYSNNTLTITGGTIKSVVITNSASSYRTQATANTGSFTTSSSEAEESWEGSTASLVLTAHATSRTQVIVVTYE